MHLYNSERSRQLLINTDTYVCVVLRDLMLIPVAVIYITRLDTIDSHWYINKKSTFLSIFHKEVFGTLQHIRI